ncbi:hypothetical protein CPB84DRAFT_1749896 [Gymnopilus junonius]|uniref:Uncharacterized protein n=1 Tax=Gymnopilus junonius TaxID=109634 RepID=A0A9P5NHI7_GYMJU|nr:hypothetical protein CPB84DRAFT_1749896 [Gymnopilus junonius]
MKSFNVLTSYVALTIVLLDAGVQASPIGSQISTDNSVIISRREPILPGIDRLSEEGRLLIREPQYDYDGYGTYYGELDDPADPDNDHFRGEVDHFCHHHHCHRYPYFARSENTEGALDRRDSVDKSVVDNQEQGNYGRHHRNIYYGRDNVDTNTAINTLSQDKREGGYHVFHHHKYHTNYHREDADFNNALGPLSLSKREEGYLGHHHHHHPHHRHYRREGGAEIDGSSHNWKNLEEVDMARDEAAEDVGDIDQYGWHHHHHKYHRETVVDTNNNHEGRNGPQKKETAEEIKEGVAHAVDTGIKSVSGFLGLDI